MTTDSIQQNVVLTHNEASLVTQQLWRYKNHIQNELEIVEATATDEVVHKLTMQFEEARFALKIMESK